jgi:hypothetical protein
MRTTAGTKACQFRKGQTMHTDAAFIAAQVACEAIWNAPEGYNASDVEAVLTFAEHVGVSATYIDGARTAFTNNMMGWN